MPIPRDYRDVCTMLFEATDAGRVNWVEKRGSPVVHLPDYDFEIWGGHDERDVEFVAVAVREPEGEAFLDNWYVEEGDLDWEMMRGLYGAARRYTHKVSQKLETLKQLLASGERVGLPKEEGEK